MQVRRYLRRPARRAWPRGEALLTSRAGTRLLYRNVQWTFQKLLCHTGIQPRSRTCGPHTHDLRHTLAVAAVLDAYRDGPDIDRRLTLLATYFGHVSPGGTYWYLSAHPHRRSSEGAPFRVTSPRVIHRQSPLRPRAMLDGGRAGIIAAQVDRTVCDGRRSPGRTRPAASATTQATDRRRVGSPGRGPGVARCPRTERHWLRMCWCRPEHLFPYLPRTCPNSPGYHKRAKTAAPMICRAMRYHADPRHTYWNLPAAPELVRLAANRMKPPAGTNIVTALADPADGFRRKPHLTAESQPARA
jgi:hypothetical protein